MRNTFDILFRYFDIESSIFRYVETVNFRYYNSISNINTHGFSDPFFWCGRVEAPPVVGTTNPPLLSAEQSRSVYVSIPRCFLVFVGMPTGAIFPHFLSLGRPGVKSVMY